MKTKMFLECIKEAVRLTRLEERAIILDIINKRQREYNLVRDEKARDVLYNLRVEIKHDLWERKADEKNDRTKRTNKN